MSDLGMRADAAGRAEFDLGQFSLGHRRLPAEQSEWVRADEFLPAATSGLCPDIRADLHSEWAGYFVPVVIRTLIGVTALFSLLGGAVTLVLASFYACGWILWRLGFAAPEDIIPIGIVGFFGVLLFIAIVIGGYALGDEWFNRRSSKCR
jgi:hypothetical protein